MAIGHPPAEPFTVDDLDGMPDDGRRWVVDPLAPSLAVYGRAAGSLARTTFVEGDDVYEATATGPVAVRVVPIDLVRDR